jgi:hypothetical protein
MGQLVENTGTAVPENTLGSYLESWWRRVRGGDLGSLPIIVGIIVIAAVFGTLQPLFCSARKFG